jgi:hypothetical protein
VLSRNLLALLTRSQGIYYSGSLGSQYSQIESVCFQSDYYVGDRNEAE